MNGIRTWQGWLDAFLRDASPEGLAANLQLNEDSEVPPESLAALYHLRTLYDEANAMLLACLQLPESEAEQALSKIAAAAHGVRFAKPPRQAQGLEKDAFRRAARILLRDYPPEADLLQSMFLYYLHDNYDAQADANRALTLSLTPAVLEQHRIETTLAILHDGGTRIIMVPSSGLTLMLPSDAVSP